MRTKIKLDTFTDINEFVAAVNPVEGKVTVEDEEGHCVNAKSLLGMMYASGEFKEKYVVSETDITYAILKFII